MDISSSAVLVSVPAFKSTLVGKVSNLVSGIEYDFGNHWIGVGQQYSDRFMNGEIQAQN